MEFQDVVALASQAVEGTGVVVIVLGAAAALGRVVVDRLRGGAAGAFEELRGALGRAILLGLELLVGADIIRTVGEVPTLDRVVVLGLIVLIRTFLSVSLQLEVEGRWPWQPPPGAYRAPPMNTYAAPAPAPPSDSPGPPTTSSA